MSFTLLNTSLQELHECVKGNKQTSQLKHHLLCHSLVVWSFPYIHSSLQNDHLIIVSSPWLASPLLPHLLLSPHIPSSPPLSPSLASPLLPLSPSPFFSPLLKSVTVSCHANSNSSLFSFAVLSTHFQSKVSLEHQLPTATQVSQ